jgi:hypothetical protein
MTQMPTMQSVMQRQGVSLLLDNLTAPQAAWSIARKLRSAYSGSAIRVVRTNDSASQDIGFTSDGLVDTAAIDSFRGSNGAYLSRIYDQSGNSRDLDVLGTSSQYMYVAPSGGALHTIGSNARLCMKQLSSQSTTILSTTTSFNWGLSPDRRTSILCVTSFGAASSGRSTARVGSNSSGHYAQASEGSHLYFDGSNRSIALTTPNGQDGSWFFVRGNGGNNDTDACINNGTLADGACSSTANDSSGTKYLQTINIDIKLAEAIIWNADMYSSKSTIMSNIVSFYGL